MYSTLNIRKKFNKKFSPLCHYVDEYFQIFNVHRSCGFGPYCMQILTMESLMAGISIQPCLTKTLGNVRTMKVIHQCLETIISRLVSLVAFEILKHLLSPHVILQFRLRGCCLLVQAFGVHLLYLYSCSVMDAFISTTHMCCNLV